MATNLKFIRCPECGANNRISIAQLVKGREPVCGRCKTPLQVETHPLTVTDETYQREIEHSPLPVLLDMWAAWCGPCLMIAPVIEQLAKEFAGQVRVAKLNVDENPVTADRFNVRSIPTLLLLKDGQELTRIVGAQPKSEIVRRMRELGLLNVV